MKKHPQKKYKPGELENTRSHLGNLSEEEARKMSKVLGGEIGLEQDPDEIEKKYKKLLHMEQRKRRLASISGARDRLSRKNKDKRDAQRAAGMRTQTQQKGQGKEKLGYLDRIRIDYLSSKPEYGLKRIPGVIASFFSFLTDIPDYINPLFIRNANEIFFFSLSSFVNSIRWLYSKTKKEIYKEISKNAFYANVLAMLKTWDVEGISLELAMLQRNSNRADTAKAIGLLRKLYRPFGILLYLDYDAHVKRAIKWAYERNLAGTPPENRVAWKNIMMQYETAIGLLPIVFVDIKRMFYPLLLKIASTRFLFFEEYFVRERRAIFRFTNLSPEYILNPLDEKTARSKGEAGRGLAEEGDEVDAIDEMEGEPLGEPAPGVEVEKATKAREEEYRAGIVILDTLFPGAGFFHLETFPDLYPYFQPLFGFPSGFELVPPTDSLQQVVVISTIIDNILFCFRHISFGIIRNAQLEPRKIKEIIELLLAKWPEFLEEIVFKTYIPRLADLCRNIEKEASFARTELGEKAVGELDAIKTTYILPFLKYKKIIRGALLPKRNYPKFYNVVAETRQLLLGISSELANGLRAVADAVKPMSGQYSGIESESVGNPLEPYVFDVSNPVSRRLAILSSLGKKRAGGTKKSIDGQTNADIIETCLTLVSTLDYLVNSEKSHFYTLESGGLYRTVNGSSGLPEYSIKLKDTQAILEKVEKDSEAVRNESLSLSEKDDEAYIIENDLVLHVSREIDGSALNPNPFSFVFFCISPDNAPHDYALRKVEDIAKSETRPGTDLLFRLGNAEYIFLLKSTDLALAKNIGTKIVTSLMSCRELTGIGCHASCGVLQYRNSWNLDSLFTIIEKIKAIVRKQAIPRLIFLDNDSLALKGTSIV